MKLISVFANTFMMLGLAVSANAQSSFSPNTDAVADTTTVNSVAANDNDDSFGKENFDELSKEVSDQYSKMYSDIRKSTRRHRRNMDRHLRKQLAYFNSPEFESMMDSLASDRRSFIDSAGNSIRFSRRNDGRHHGFSKMMSSNVDSLGNSTSTVIINDGKRTMVIKNGKDTTWYNNNAPIPDFAMPDVDMSQFDDMMKSFQMPDFDGLPDWFRQTPRVRTIAPIHRNGFAAENPSDEELDMLTKGKVVTSANLKSPLDVLDINLAPSRSGAMTFTYKLPRAQKSMVKVVDAEGKVIDAATLSLQGGEFRRTFKLDKSQQYLYIIISADSKFAVSKFWL